MPKSPRKQPPPPDEKSSSGKSNPDEASIRAGQQIMAEGNAKLLASLEKKLKEQYKIDDGPYDYGADCIIALTQATKPDPCGPGKIPDNAARAQGVKMFVQVIDGLPADKIKANVNVQGSIMAAVAKHLSGNAD
ncbi:MAG: hypothetical protein WC294_06015 [Methanoregula sp.]|jgi:hypothetical protein